MSTAGRWGQAVVAWLWVLAAAAGLIALLRLGGGGLGPPPLLHPSRLTHWAENRDAATMAFALLRLVAIVAAGYLLAATLLGLLARATRIPALVAATDMATLPLVRRLLAALVGAGLTATIGVNSLALHGTGPGPSPARVETRAGPGDGSPAHRRSDPISRTPAEPSHGQSSRRSVVITRLPDEAPPTPGDGTATMEVTGPPSRVDPVPATPTPAAWTVGPGDNFWLAAESTLARAWDRPPTESETTDYWRSLVEHNRNRLAVPENADLIYPGQVFERPALPPRP